MSTLNLGFFVAVINTKELIESSYGKICSLLDFDGW